MFIKKLALLILAASLAACTTGESKHTESFVSIGVETGTGTGRAWSVAEKSVERPATVTMKGKPVTLLGESPNVGDFAPSFTAVANDLSSWKFAPTVNGNSKITILSAVPSLDTGTCSRETKRFNEEATKVEGVEIVTISMDLPFAQKRWCGAEGVTHLTTVSDFKDREFARNYGVRIKENGLLARAVWVIGKDGKILYREICSELASEPDYAKIMDAAKAAAK